MSTSVLFDFNASSDLSAWKVVDDVVMGGRSSGSFELNEEGHGVFSGAVSLENNGGFSSVRCTMEQVAVEGRTTVIIRLKGDGKKYQFRVKDDAENRHSYIASFETSGEWQTIEIELHEMIPSFRGRTLDLPNFDQPQIEELAFLIGNKKPEKFKLEVDSIVLN